MHVIDEGRMVGSLCLQGAGETLSRSLSGNSSLRGQPSFASDASTPSPRSGHGHGSSRSPRQRTSPLNSGLWITIELTITISQIIASIIVLSVSRDEHPQAPLQVWVIGYAAGCLATLPLLYWRYTHRYVRSREQNALPQASSSSVGGSGGSGATSYRSLSPPRAQSGMTQAGRHGGLDGQESVDDDRYDGGATAVVGLVWWEAMWGVGRSVVVSRWWGKR